MPAARRCPVPSDRDRAGTGARAGVGAHDRVHARRADELDLPGPGVVYRVNHYAQDEQLRGSPAGRRVGRPSPATAQAGRQPGDCSPRAAIVVLLWHSAARGRVRRSARPRHLEPTKRDAPLQQQPVFSRSNATTACEVRRAPIWSAYAMSPARSLKRMPMGVDCRWGSTCGLHPSARC